ncbi:hypothetical protein GCM10011529_15650 [Polymorphobacter glacialis]|uniref:Ice-binding protein C-terminal domain-containing protein n=1 Tax=Sandarakinorhabdus glacialis TaxID=1614636 RepID=A0A916ZRB7_9SPHN|nr:PEPxxWA-CTERM sorting domain-containing protein [Polymorphobacter glacialis]GGE10157.1 hypothetical protein GCM10011529_15650 [Polymorphobacter glacialis]
MKKILIGIAALASAATAQASIIPTLIGAPVAVGNGSFRYTYDATLASDQALVTGSYFTLYDLVGFQGFGNLASGFTGTSQLLGLTPGNVLPDDDASILNVSFVYSGPTVNFDGQLFERQLGTFEIFSTIGTVGFDDFTSEAIRNAGPSRGSLVATIGTDAIGVPGDGMGSTVPEPAMWAMLIAGFGMVGVRMRTRNGALQSVSA